MSKQLKKLARLYALAKPGSPHHGVLALFAGLATVLYNLIMANALQAVFAAATAGNRDALITQIVVFALSIGGFFLYNGTFWGFFGASVARMTGHIRKALFAHLCRLSTASLEQGRSAAAVTLFASDASSAENAYGSLLRFAVAASSSGLVATALLLSNQLAMGLIILGTGFAQLACNLFAAKPLQRLSARIAGQVEEVNTAMGSLLDGNGTIRLYGMEHKVMELYRRKSLELQALNRKLCLVEGIIRGSNVVMAMASYLLVLAAGAWMASTGDLTVPELLFLTQVRGLVMLVVFSLGDVAQMAQPALASAERLFSFLDKPAEKQQDNR